MRGQGGHLGSQEHHGITIAFNPRNKATLSLAMSDVMTVTMASAYMMTLVEMKKVWDGSRLTPL